MKGHATAMRDLTAAETATVSGADSQEFFSYVGVGATIGASFGAPVGAALLPIIGTAYGMIGGGFVGGVFGGAYYAFGELVDYCF